MSVLSIVVIVLCLGLIGYFAGRTRAMQTSGGDVRKLHSMPTYYGWNVLMAAVVPSLLVLAAWLLIAPALIDVRISAQVPPEAIPEGSSLGLVMSDVRRVAGGLQEAVRQDVLTEEAARSSSTALSDVHDGLAAVGIALGSNIEAATLEAAQNFRAARNVSNLVLSVVVLTLAAVGLVYALWRTHYDLRARNTVEKGILALLILASTIAILTTVGIVMSMLLEANNFLGQYRGSEFFFGLRWNPSFSGRGGGSELGLLPLLWGTLYISFVALVVAVPIGIYAAIYLSEYANNRFRSFAKPMIEILAGIPTIVYGLFALITVGPLIRDFIAQPLGLGNSASSVMTAGLVMGIMLIPFVSSLSDDIINAVPQAMRDGSYGLGATKSETIRQVIIPAALPGIVGAILLAASRAIGETMIVVLGAGASAAQFEDGRFLNPFEAMTTVTVKIVSQLTGDTDFNSPETLVAFALGLTLFVITLGLNVLALYIVRKYREQYE